MNGEQKRKCSKPQPGWKGRMSKMFDMDGGVSGNRLLTDKPRRYTPQSDPVDLDSSTEDDLISTRKNSGKTPMKMHLEHELSKEGQSSHTPPNLVARLMGLDTVPKRKDDVLGKREHDCGCRVLDSEEAFPSSLNESRLLRKPSEDEHYLKEFVSDRYHGTGENLVGPEESEIGIRKSYEDLFLEFHRQPRPLSTLPPSGVTRITVLKPCNTADNNNFPGMKSEKWVSKPTQASHVNMLNKPNYSGFPVSSNWKDGDEHQPSHIVVLKPSLEKSSHIVDEYISPSMSPRTPHGKKSFIEEMEPDAKPLKGTKEVTSFISKNLGSLQTDDHFLSPVLSSGYSGDESSLDESENEYATGSDSGAMSPTSRFSWRHVNQLAGSSSSVGHKPQARDSFICSDAKRHHSRKWSYTGLNSHSQQRHARSLSSSTLGEMLGLSVIRMPIGNLDGNGEEPVSSSACLNQQFKEDMIAEHSPAHLRRSKSVPLSVDGNSEWANVGKFPDGKQHLKTSSFKSLVTSLFFSRNKKFGKESLTAGLYKNGSSATSIQIQESQSGQMAADTSSHEVGLSVTKPVTTGNIMDSQDQPSPNSVLEPLFPDDESRSADSSGILHIEHPVADTSESKTNSHTLGKSPRIESVARTLWNSSCADASTSCPFNLSLVCTGPQEEQDWCLVVPALLSTLGLSNDVPSGACMDRWYAPQIPLDPLLRDNYSYIADYAMHEGKRRCWRSNRKLIFDSVSKALLDIALSHLETNSSGHCETVLPVLVDQVWAKMSQWISDKVRCLSSNDGEETNQGVVVERVARREVAGKRWVDVISTEINMVGIDIERMLLADLLEEAVLQLTARYCLLM